MIPSEQFKCLIPTPNAINEGVLYCSTNASNAVDIWIAVGTVGATVAAVAFGIRGEFRAHREQKRAEIAERRLRLHGPGQKIVESFERLVSSKVVSQKTLPPGNSEILPYRSLLDREGPIEQEFGSALGSFATSTILKLESMLPKDDQGANAGESVTLTIIQTMILTSVVSTIRQGVTNMLYAETESERQQALASFKKSADKVSEDMKNFEEWEI